MKDDKKQSAKTAESNEGEGSYTATHRYNAGVAKSVAKGDSTSLAQKAARALDGPEGEELRRAEREGKARAADKPKNKPTKRPAKNQ